MPCYNALKHLPEALACLGSQTWRDFEVVAVDDGSTDGTGDLLDAYAAEHPWLRAVHQANSGRPAAARNAGIGVARGEVICFLDADDLWDHNKLAEIAHVFEHRPDVAAVFHDYRFVADDGSLLAPSAKAARIDKSDFAAAWEHDPAGDRLFIARNSAYARFLSGPIVIHTSAAAIHRRRAETFEIGFDEALTCYEDIDLWLRCVAELRCAFVDRVLGAYRDADESITKRRAVMNADGAKLYERHFRHPLKPLLPSERGALRRRIAADHFDAAYCFASERQWRAALAGYLRSCAWRPSLRAVQGVIKLAGRAVLDLMDLRRAAPG